MQPSRRLLSGMPSGLQTVAIDESFYWVPSATNLTLPGIDAVLGGSDGNMYAVQATIAEEHGLWPHIRQLVQQGRTLHVVVVADKRDVARVLTSKFSEELKDDGPFGGRIRLVVDVRFGQQCVRVDVWGYVMNEDAFM